jgi:hypothetical protein
MEWSQKHVKESMLNVAEHDKSSVQTNRLIWKILYHKISMYILLLVIHSFIQTCISLTMVNDTLNKVGRVV